MFNLSILLRNRKLALVSDTTIDENIFAMKHQLHSSISKCNHNQTETELNSLLRKKLLFIKIIVTLRFTKMTEKELKYFLYVHSCNNIFHFVCCVFCIFTNSNNLFIFCDCTLRKIK